MEPSLASHPHLLTAAASALGGKGANMARLTALGLPVPPWFAVSAEAMASAAAGLDLAGRLAGAALEDPAGLAAASAGARSAILAAPLPAGLEDALVDRVASCFGEAPLAVRSSAEGEDGARHSFAGQFDTFLFVTGREGLCHAVKACWASAYSERALAYRLAHGLPLAGVRVAVVVQAMVAGTVSGVLFTANPMTGKRSEMVVSAAWGLGEGLVSGRVDADTFVVDRPSGDFTTTVAEKRWRALHDPENGGTGLFAVPEEQVAVACLAREQVLELVRLGARLEAELGAPQDVEWTYRGGALHVLQTRPITTLPADPDGQVRLFDNSNIVESYAGVTTPLTFSFASRAYEVAYQQLAVVFGFEPAVVRRLEPLFKNMLALVQGRVYYNLGNWYALLAEFPAYGALKGFFSNSIGATTDAGGPAAAVARGAWPLFKLACRMAWNFARWDAEVARFSRRFKAVHARMRAEDLTRRPVERLVAAYLDVERELLWDWTPPLVNDFFAMVFYGLLKGRIGAWGLDGAGSLQNDLLAGEGGIESTEPTKAIIRMARLAAADPALTSLFTTTPAAEIDDRLDAAPFAAFKGLVTAYMAAFGDRCMGELKLESVPMTEDPTFLFTAVANYMASPAALDLERMEAREQAVRAAAEATARKALAGRPFRGLFFFWLLAQTRKAIKNRENMRFAKTRAFGIARSIFGEVGRKLAGAGVLASPRDVYYLGADELVGWVQGRALTTDLQGLAELRKREFAAYHAATPADRFETRGPVYLGNDFQGEPVPMDTTDPHMLRGTSCCPGVVSGPVRVIRSPQDDMRLRGEILVAERTDPGWVPLYPSVSGLLIERGSVLSHSAIVAREMGLPTIVGIPGLVSRVADGQTVEMDGRAGTVRLAPEHADG